MLGHVGNETWARLSFHLGQMGCTKAGLCQQLLMLCLCRSLQHTSSRLELGFSTVSPGTVTCCSVLVPLLLQTLQSSRVWHGRPRENLLQTALEEPS